MRLSTSDIQTGVVCILPECVSTAVKAVFNMECRKESWEQAESEKSQALVSRRDILALNLLRLIWHMMEILLVITKDNLLRTK